MCSGTLASITGAYSFQSKLIGIVDVPHISFTQCDSCSERTISLGESEKVRRYVKLQEAEAIQKLPIEAFCTVKQAYHILGFTKQAFSKNQKIQNGFIISHTMDDKSFYLISSVYAFKNNGDGRIGIGIRQAPINMMKLPTSDVVINASHLWITETTQVLSQKPYPRQAFFFNHKNKGPTKKGQLTEAKYG